MSLTTNFISSSLGDLGTVFTQLNTFYTTTCNYSSFTNTINNTTYLTLVLTTDGTITFNTSGINIYGVVIGGGGGGSNGSIYNGFTFTEGGGGGGGNYSVFNFTTTSGTNYSVTIGPGGQGATSSSLSSGKNGGTTSFETYSAEGGSGGTTSAPNGGSSPSGALGGNGFYQTTPGSPSTNVNPTPGTLVTITYGPGNILSTGVSGGGGANINYGGGGGSKSSGGGAGTSSTFDGQNGKSIGCGGGGCYGYNTAGNGDPGGVYISFEISNPTNYVCNTGSSYQDLNLLFQPQLTTPEVYNITNFVVTNYTPCWTTTSGTYDLGQIFENINPPYYTLTGTYYITSNSSYNTIIYFTGNGTIVFNTSSINVQYFAVGAGGNGGNVAGGGGGGGGQVLNGNFSYTSLQQYTITIGTTGGSNTLITGGSTNITSNNGSNATGHNGGTSGSGNPGLPGLLVITYYVGGIGGGSYTGSGYTQGQGTPCPVNSTIYGVGGSGGIGIYTEQAVSGLYNTGNAGEGGNSNGIAGSGGSGVVIFYFNV